MAAELLISFRGSGVELYGQTCGHTQCIVVGVAAYEPSRRRRRMLRSGGGEVWWNVRWPRQKAQYTGKGGNRSPLLEKYQETRRALAVPVLAADEHGTEQTAARRERMEKLSDEKESLERQLVAELAGERQRLAFEQSSPSVLAEHLPPDTVAVDMLRYHRGQWDPNLRGKEGVTWADCYVAFVLCRGKPITRIEFGPIVPVNEAISKWREAISEGKSSYDPAELRRLVWEPIERALPNGVKTVYLFPDDALTRLPWAALPGRRPGSVLLEDYELAVVPNGHVLLEQCTAPRSTDDRGCFSRWATCPTTSNRDS